MSTTRIRFAVQYPPREGSGKDPLYLTAWDWSKGPLAEA